MVKGNSNDVCFFCSDPWGKPVVIQIGCCAICFFVGWWKTTKKMELWSRILGRSNAHAVNMKSVMKLEEFHAVESLFWSLDYCIGSCPIICHLHWSCIISFLIDFVVSIRLCCFFFCPESVADCSTNDFGRWIGAPSHLAANPSLSTSEKAYHSRWQWREATYEATSWHSSQPANKSERYIYIPRTQIGALCFAWKGPSLFWRSHNQK